MFSARNSKSNLTGLFLVKSGVCGTLDSFGKDVKEKYDRGCSADYTDSTLVK